MSEHDRRLSDACSKGDVARVRSCLGRGADVNWRHGWGMTPLMQAVCNNFPQVVSELLIHQGLDITVDSKMATQLCTGRHVIPVVLPVWQCWVLTVV